MEKKSKKTSKRLNLLLQRTSNIVYMLKDKIKLLLGKKSFKKMHLTLTLLAHKWYNSTINN